MVVGVLSALLCSLLMVSLKSSTVGLLQRLSVGLRPSSYGKRRDASALVRAPQAAAHACVPASISLSLQSGARPGAPGRWRDRARQRRDVADAKIAIARAQAALGEWRARPAGLR
ncbi:hypothetical protein T492DRAFT_234566 [Pavlovales sp. CCMP2436]|nr:hypothetical protein T492DRAFT_234566 [Pavlovales sp. CCMP2436]